MDNDDSRKPELITRRPQDISDAYDWLLEEERLMDVLMRTMDMQLSVIPLEVIRYCLWQVHIWTLVPH